MLRFSSDCLWCLMKTLYIKHKGQNFICATSTWLNKKQLIFIMLQCLSQQHMLVNIFLFLFSIVETHTFFTYRYKRWLDCCMLWKTTSILPCMQSYPILSVGGTINKHAQTSNRIHLPHYTLWFCIFGYKIKYWYLQIKTI